MLDLCTLSRRHPTPRCSRPSAGESDDASPSPSPAQHAMPPWCGSCPCPRARVPIGCGRPLCLASLAPRIFRGPGSHLLACACLRVRGIDNRRSVTRRSIVHGSLNLGSARRLPVSQSTAPSGAHRGPFRTSRAAFRRHRVCVASPLPPGGPLCFWRRGGLLKQEAFPRKLQIQTHNSLWCWCAVQHAVPSSSRCMRVRGAAAFFEGQLKTLLAAPRSPEPVYVKVPVYAGRKLLVDNRSTGLALVAASCWSSQMEAKPFQLTNRLKTRTRGSFARARRPPSLVCLPPGRSSR